MALSKERMGEIALAVLMHKLKKEGLHIKPKELRREVTDAAKALKIPTTEMGEFFQVGMKVLFEEAMNELDYFKPTPVPV